MKPSVTAAPHGEARKPGLHPLKTYGSSELFEGSTEVGIEHAGFLYRLKITRQGKLILNK
nr:hemin uptake protein HemP [Phyllobacterium leguminum]